MVGPRVLRSRTAPLAHATRGKTSGRARPPPARDLVAAPRPAPRRQPGPPRRRGGGARPPALRQRPGPAAGRGPGPGGLARRRAGRPRRRAPRGGRARVERRRGPAEDAVPRVAAEVGGAGTVHVSADFGPYGRRRDVRVAEGPRGGRPHPAGDRVPVRGRPRHAAQPVRHPVQVSRPSTARGPRGASTAPRNRSNPTAVTWVASERRVALEDPDPGLLPFVGSGTPAPPGGSGSTARRRGRPTTSVSTTCRRPTPPPTCPRPCAGGTSTRARCWPTWPARRRGSGGLRPSGGLARLLRRRAVEPARRHPEPVQPRFRDFERDDPATSGVAAARLDAWQQGRTGYPLVDAGMRQLLAEGWMHNPRTARGRVVPGQGPAPALGGRGGVVHGAPARRRRGQQPAQLAVGRRCGNDPSPFYRVFNPTLQSTKFDPDGHYIRRWVPELASVSGSTSTSRGSPRGPAARLPGAGRRPQGRTPRGPGPLPAGPRLSASPLTSRSVRGARGMR